MPLSSSSKAIPSQGEGQHSCPDLSGLHDLALGLESLFICDGKPIFFFSPSLLVTIFSFLFLDHITHIICSGLCYYSFFPFGEQSIYNAVLLSSLQQNESIIQIHVSTFFQIFQILFPCSIPVTEYSVMTYMGTESEKKVDTWICVTD